MSVNEGFFDGFLDDYFAESEEHLTAAGEVLVSLDQSLGDPARERQAVDDLFRYFHTLKAISAMVELRPAEQLAHHLENYLRAIRERETDLSSEGSDVLVEGTRRLEQIIAAHRLHHDQPSIDDVVQRIDAVAHRGRPAPATGDRRATPRSDGTRNWICTFVPTRDLIARGEGVDAIRKQLSAVANIVEAAPRVLPDGTITFQFTLASPADVDLVDKLRDIPVSVEPVAVAAPVPVAVPDSPISGSHVVRVDLARLDELMRNVGDLVINRARLMDSLARIEHHVPGVEWRAVQENSVVLDRQLRTLREGIMRIRLVPIGEIFRRMPFVVRDLARDTGKKVSLELRGQSTEIDKYVIERMLDPVLHLVRNAVSHGIEPPDVRVARGKKPEGTITLAASTAGDIVTLEISDDGQGVNADAVAAKARRLNLPVPSGPLDSAALLSLLCAPGFSIKEETDRASGRGVGMAVVKETVEQLSGTITLDTTPGEGTRFFIQLPLTLSIVDALIGRVGTEAFAIPQTAVREVIAVSGDDVRSIEKNDLLPYRDGTLPIVKLSQMFGISGASPSRFHVFVVGYGAHALGLAVDRIVGQREIVVRAIVDPLARVEGISGATDLGDGRVVLILDPTAIVRATQQRSPRALSGAGHWGRLPAGA